VEGRTRARVIEERGGDARTASVSRGNRRGILFGDSKNDQGEYVV
jgi:hypothetical protein